MQAAVEISYRNVEKSQAADDSIRAHVAYLERIYDRITACRVWVDNRADTLHDEILPAVSIELQIPGFTNLVVAHDPADTDQNFQSPDLNNAIYKAFRLAERRLLDLKQIRQTNERIAHETDLSFLGQIAEIYPLEDYGYLLNKEGALVYFHRNALVSGDFDYLVRGMDAYYVEEAGSAGPLAKKVWVRESSH
ncbi:MAG: HPF/RaiA family ribosome-associated protein [Rhizobiales bacterium]|nr:HPF/RaiA family ribosome-associated protein [Hyphomicrobiales bacterium]